VPVYRSNKPLRAVSRVKEPSFEEKIAKIQRYLPQGLTEKILSQRDRIEAERKQVTVLFVDMAGYTPLSEKLDPEDAYPPLRHTPEGRSCCIEITCLAEVINEVRLQDGTEAEVMDYYFKREGKKERQ